MEHEVDLLDGVLYEYYCCCWLLPRDYNLDGRHAACSCSHHQDHHTHTSCCHHHRLENHPCHQIHPSLEKAYYYCRHDVVDCIVHDESDYDVGDME